MGRKSYLSSEQWAEIGKRLLEGEGPSAISRDLASKGITLTESSIRSHFDRKGQKTSTIQDVASKLFEADQELRKLPIEAQAKAATLAARLRTISENLASAAENSSATALRLTALANEEIQKVDDAQPEQTSQNLKNSALLTKLANEAAHIPLNLLAANRETVKRFNDEPPPADDEITPERMTAGARRIAFMLARVAHQEKT